MTDPGLSNRLRQHSRRAGLNVGVSMAFAIAICILGFATIYAQLTPVLSDFVGQDPRDAPVARTAPPPAGQQASTGGLQPTPGEVASAPPAEPPTPTPPPPTPTPESQAFEPTLQSNSSQSVNLRSTPGTGGGDASIITTLPAATPLESLNEEQAVDGDPWIRVRTEDGTEGWILANATEPYDPNA